MSSPGATDNASPSPDERRRQLEALLRRKQQPRHFPLSLAQQRLWLLDQLDPGNPVYNIPLAVRLTGALDLPALQKTLDAVIARHEVLRTRIAQVGAEPAQIVEPPAARPLEIIDVPGADAAAREAAALERARAEARRPFQLDVGPLFRAQLLRLGPEEHIFVAVMHHAIGDDWSLGVLFHDVARLYQAFTTGQPSPLTALPIQYADYAAWQRQQLQGAELERLLDYWTPRLQAVSPLELPTDRPRPQQASYAGGTVTRIFPIDLLAQVRELARGEAATLYMALLTAFDVLLYRYSGQEDFAVGSPIAGRTRKETESLVGFFANTLVMRATLDPAATFRQTLRQVKRHALDAFQHQEMPFERLVEVLNPPRDTGRHPLFQVAFALQSAPWPQITLAGLTLAPLPIDSGAAKFELWLSMRETPAGLQADLEFNAELFTPETARRMLAHLETLLRAAVANPDQPLTRLPLQTGEEQRQMLHQWNLPAPAEPLTGCLHAWFEAAAAQHPAAIAVRFEEQELTYGELNRRANQVAHYLRSQGVGPESIVALYLDRSLEMIVALLGIVKAGGAYLPMDLVYPADRLAFMLEESQARVVITQESLVEKLPAHAATVLCLDRDAALLAAQDASNPPCTTDAQNLAYVIYTSGSTGKPKGAMITQGNVVRLFTATDDWFHFSAADVWTMFHSYAFDFSVWEIWGALLYGGTLVVVPYWVSRSPEAFHDMLVRRGVTVLNQTPSAFTQLVTYDQQAGEKSAQLQLRLVIFGGEALNLQSLRPWFERHGDRCPQLVNMYGITETTVHVTYYPVTRADLANPSSSPIGRPIPDLQVYVLDTHGNLAPIGVPGELYVGGRGVARGYLQRPELTAGRFVDPPFAEAAAAGIAGPLYRSGDVGRWLPGGCLEYLGRCDHQVKIRGFRIELGEIEAVLARHPAIRQAVVLAREDRQNDKRLVAYIVPTIDPPPSTSDLRGYLRAALPDYMIPAAFVPLESIPLTGNGKVDRRALPAADDKRPELSVQYVAPRTDDEAQLAAIWCEVLGVDRVGVDDNFFELGGHSLLATQVISRIVARLKVELPLREMFLAPSVGQLAQRLIEARTQGRGRHHEPIRPAPRDGTLLPSFTQEALWFLDQLERDHPTYTVYPTLRIRGPLDVAVLERALNEISRRHEALRTRFPEVDGRPIQVIEPWQPRPLPLVDLSPLPQPQRRSELRRWVAEETERPINLQTGPLIRITLLKLSADEHVLVAAAHHIIYDGWSLGIMSRELSALYESYRAGRPATLPELSIQYADFAAWQRQLLQGPRLEQLRSYWAQKLAGVPPLELPTDLPRPAVRTTRGDTLPCDLPADVAAAVREFCRSEGLTPFMALLAAFEVLLSRYAGQEDFAIGSPVANRIHPQTEPLVGYFINMVVLRADTGGDPSFRELARRVRQTALDAYEHQELTLDSVVDAVRPTRDASRHPLFQAMFVLQNNEPPSLANSGLAVDFWEEAPSGHAAFFELTLALGETPEGFQGSLNYNTDLFHGETIRRMAAHFPALLAGLLREPDRPLSAVPLATAEERQTLVQQWSQRPLDRSSHACIHDLFDGQARQTPNAVALIDGDRRWTYAELNARANQLAHYLQARGVGPDRLVAVRLPRSAELIAALWGVLKAGGAYVPLDPHLPAQRLQFTLDDAQVDVVITLEALRGDLPDGLPHIVCLDRDAAAIDAASRETPHHAATPANLAYVIYTSGSTGRPKGVMIEHRALVNYVHAVTAEYEITVADRVLQFASVSYDAHVEEVYPALVCGATLLLRSDDMLDARRFLERCRDWKTTFITVPTGFWHELTAAIVNERLTLPVQLRLVVIGGESAMPQRVATWFQCVGTRVRLLNTYGPTETTVVATSAPMSPADGRVQRLPIGRPLGNMRTYVLDAALEPVPVGVRGELYIGGASLGRGYLRRPELTAEKFVPDPFAAALGDVGDARMYRTGDVVRWRPDGQLEFIGRTDHQVKIRGFRIEPGEVERVLREHPALADAAVVALPRAPGDLQLAGYYAPAGVEIPTAAELRRFLAARLPEFMIPAAFVSLPALPATASGKIDRRSLPPPDWSAAARSGQYVAPQTPTQQALAQVWAELLRTERVGIEDNFFDLGGNSLLAMRLMSRIRETLSADVPLVHLFTSPTVAALAAVVDRAKAGQETLSQISEAVDWNVEMELDAAIRVTPELAPPAAVARNVLLSGATGFLGAYLLRELLQRSDVVVHCLVRARNPASAREKIAKNLAAYGLEALAAGERIVPVCGDLGQPRLGLSAEQFATLAETVDAIYHNGAQVNPVYPYPMLKASNVGGTIEVLRLATRCRVKPVHFVSTVSVFDSAEYGVGGPVPEDRPLEIVAGLASGYAQSKCVAETLVRAAGQRGVPVAIYRPGRITADSTSGAANLGDQTTFVIKLCVQMGLAPATDARTDMTPVDYVARAIAVLAARSDSYGHTFHLFNPEPSSVGALYAAIRRRGHRLEEVSFERWREAVIELGRDSADDMLSGFAQMLQWAPPERAAQTSGHAEAEVVLDCRATVTALARCGVTCPVIDERMREQYLEFLERKGALPASGTTARGAG